MGDLFAIVWAEARKREHVDKNPSIRALVFVCHDVENTEKVSSFPHPKHVKTSTVVFNTKALSWRCKHE